MEFRLERVPSSRLLPPTAYTKLSITATPGGGGRWRGRKEERKGGREEGRKREREEEREGGREGGRKREREEERKGGREGREEEREGGWRCENIIEV